MVFQGFIFLLALHGTLLNPKADFVRM